MKKETNTTLNSLVIPVMSGQFGFILRAGNKNRHEELTMFFFLQGKHGSAHISNNRGKNDRVLNGGTADHELKTTVESTSRVNSQCKE